ncbi:hypothetical protein QFZ75_001772 [Streptomyces sp. V3I8]|nr:hypothetical protein [Streptomyces sp. V3I8]
MPSLPACLLEPLRDQFVALLPVREEFVVDHLLGCHRRRIPDRTVFEHVVLALVHGSGYERISTPGCSDRTIRRRLKEWSRQGISKALHALALDAYDRMIGLDLGEISVDGCITKAPSGREKAGRSPVDRGKQGLKRSAACDARGVPLGIVSEGANSRTPLGLSRSWCCAWSAEQGVLAGGAGAGPAPQEVLEGVEDLVEGEDVPGALGPAAVR